VLLTKAWQRRINRRAPRSKPTSVSVLNDHCPLLAFRLVPWRLQIQDPCRIGLGARCKPTSFRLALIFSEGQRPACAAAEPRRRRPVAETPSKNRPIVGVAVNARPATPLVLIMCRGASFDLSPNRGIRYRQNGLDCLGSGGPVSIISIANADRLRLCYHSGRHGQLGTDG
jgi:hypothetical protein